MSVFVVLVHGNEIPYTHSRGALPQRARLTFEQHCKVPNSSLIRPTNHYIGQSDETRRRRQSIFLFDLYDPTSRRHLVLLHTRGVRDFQELSRKLCDRALARHADTTNNSMQSGNLTHKCNSQVPARFGHDTKRTIRALRFHLQ